MLQEDIFKKNMFIRSGRTTIELTWKNDYFNWRDLKYIGNNVIIGKNVRIRQPENVSIDDGTIIDDFTYISSVLKVGKYCHIASNVSISGGKGKLTMGDYSTLSNHCSIHCASSDYRYISLDLPSVPEEKRYGGEVEDIIIGNHVVVGAHCCILPGSKLPDYSAYGAYTLIKKWSNLSEYCLYAGHDCKFIGNRKKMGKK